MVLNATVPVVITDTVWQATQ